MTITAPPPGSPPPAASPVAASPAAADDGAPSVVARAQAVLAELAEVLWAARAAGEKMETVAALEELKSLADAIELQVVADLEATRATAQLGWASTKDFVTSVAGGFKGQGPATVRLAEALEQPLLAPVAQALADGWLSTAKAHVVERTITELPVGNNERARELRIRAVQVMLEQAKALDATDLRKAGRHLLERLDPDGGEKHDQAALDREERAAHLDRNLSVTDDGAGGARIKGRCTSEDAATIRAALMSLAAPVPSADGRPTCDPATCREPGCAHDGRDPRDHGARMLDALVEACRRLMAAGILPTSHGVATRVNVTMAFEDLLRQSGHATTATGEDLSPQAARRMACDAEIVPVVLGSESQVLDVGRLMRLVSAAIWYALMVRDQHCRFPGCSRPPVMCHAHHVVHWIDGGVTSLDNLVLLCGHHHRLVHAGPWRVIQPQPGVFDFTPPDAVRRARGPRPDRAPPGE